MNTKLSSQFQNKERQSVNTRKVTWTKLGTLRFSTLTIISIFPAPARAASIVNVQGLPTTAFSTHVRRAQFASYALEVNGDEETGSPSYSISICKTNQSISILMIIVVKKISLSILPGDFQHSLVHIQ